MQQTDLALQKIVISLYLEDVARLASHIALGNSVVPPTGAAQHSILQLQLLAVSGFTRVVDTTVEEKGKSFNSHVWWMDGKERQINHAGAS